MCQRVNEGGFNQYVIESRKLSGLPRSLSLRSEHRFLGPFFHAATVVTTAAAAASATTALRVETERNRRIQSDNINLFPKSKFANEQTDECSSARKQSEQCGASE